MPRRSPILMSEKPSPSYLVRHILELSSKANLTDLFFYRTVKEEIEKSGMPLEEIGRELANIVSCGSAADRIEANQLMRYYITRSYGFQSLPALIAYDNGLRDLRKKEKARAEEVHSLCSREPDEHLLSRSVEEEKGGNIFAAALSADQARDYSRSLELYERIIDDDSLSLLERANIIVKHAIFTAKTARDDEKVLRLYRKASEFYERAAQALDRERVDRISAEIEEHKKSIAKDPSHRQEQCAACETPDDLKRETEILDSNISSRDYFDIYDEAARWAEMAGDFTRAAQLRLSKQTEHQREASKFVAMFEQLEGMVDGLKNAVEGKSSEKEIEKIREASYRERNPGPARFRADIVYSSGKALLPENDPDVDPAVVGSEFLQWVQAKELHYSKDTEGFKRAVMKECERRILYVMEIKGHYAALKEEREKLKRELDSCKNQRRAGALTENLVRNCIEETRLQKKMAESEAEIITQTAKIFKEL